MVWATTMPPPDLDDDEREEGRIFHFSSDRNETKINARVSDVVIPPARVSTACLVAGGRRGGRVACG